MLQMHRPSHKYDTYCCDHHFQVVQPLPPADCDHHHFPRLQRHHPERLLQPHQGRDHQARHRWLAGTSVHGNPGADNVSQDRHQEVIWQNDFAKRRDIISA